MHHTFMDDLDGPETLGNEYHAILVASDSRVYINLMYRNKIGFSAGFTAAQAERLAQLLLDASDAARDQEDPRVV